MNRVLWRPIAAVAALGAALLLVFVSSAAAATPTPKPPPAIAQLCAATGIDQVDNLLDGVARSELVGALAPLVTLTVPDRDTVEIDASVQLDQVRKALNCGPVATPTSTASPTTTVAPPTTEPTTAPTTTAPPTAQVPRLPSGAAETGGGPA